MRSLSSVEEEVLRQAAVILRLYEVRELTFGRLVVARRWFVEEACRGLDIADVINRCAEQQRAPEYCDDVIPQAKYQKE